MTDIFCLDLLCLMCYLLAVVFLHYGWGSAFRPDVRLFLLCVLLLATLLSLSNVLEWSGLTSIFNRVEDHLEILFPMLWGMFFYAFLQDIAAQDLRQSEMRYELAARSGQVAVWEWDVVHDEMYICQGLKSMLNYQDPDFPSSRSSLFALVHADDLARLNITRQQLINGEVEQFECEMRVLHNDGGYRWFLVRGASRQDLAGKAKWMVGTLIDISALKQAEARIIRALQEKEVLLREVHHRVKNNLQIVSSLLDLQFERFQDRRTQEILLRTQERIKAISFVHEMLYQTKELAAIDFADYVERLTMFLFNFAHSDLQGVTIKNHVRPVSLDINTAILCGLMINELVTNALKHAFPPGRQGTIWIDFDEQDSVCTLIVRDDGQAAAVDLNDPDHYSLGLQLVSSFAGQLKGRMEYSQDNGTVFKVVFARKDAVPG